MFKLFVTDLIIALCITCLRLFARESRTAQPFSGLHMLKAPVYLQKMRYRKNMCVHVFFII